VPLDAALSATRASRPASPAPQSLESIFHVRPTVHPGGTWKKRPPGEWSVRTTSSVWRSQLAVSLPTRKLVNGQSTD